MKLVNLPERELYPDNSPNHFLHKFNGHELTVDNGVLLVYIPKTIGEMQIVGFELKNALSNEQFANSCFDKFNSGHSALVCFKAAEGQVTYNAHVVNKELDFVKGLNNVSAVPSLHATVEAFLKDIGLIK